MRSLGLLALTALLSAGCLVSSLQPLYDDETLLFDERLLGTWENRESETNVVVSRGEWRSYVVAFTDRFGTTRFTAHLTALGPARFLNLRPEDGLERPAFLVVTNGILQIEVKGSTVRVREPDYATILERLEAGKLGMDAALDLKQNVVVTASPSRLRAWARASLQDDALWAEWKTFSRGAR